MSELQLPFLSVNEFLFSLKVLKSGVLIPPALQLGFKTYITDPLHSVINFFREDVTLLEEFDLVLGVGTNGLGEVGGNGVKEVKVDRGVILELPTDNGVI